MIGVKTLIFSQISQLDVLCYWRQLDLWLIPDQSPGQVQHSF